MLEQSKYRLLGCLDYSLSAFFQVGLNEKAIYSEFRITAVMPESPSCTVSCLTWDSSSFTGKGSRCLPRQCGSEELAHNRPLILFSPISSVDAQTPCKWVLHCLPLSSTALSLKMWWGWARSAGEILGFPWPCFSARDLLSSRAPSTLFTTEISLTSRF